MPDCPDNGPYPWETPVLRADALDDDLDLEDEEVPRYATGGIVKPADDGSDSVPVILTRGEIIFEPYENSEGGWSFRRVVVP